MELTHEQGSLFHSKRNTRSPNRTFLGIIPSFLFAKEVSFAAAMARLSGFNHSMAPNSLLLPFLSNTFALDSCEQEKPREKASL